MKLFLAVDTNCRKCGECFMKHFKDQLKLKTGNQDVEEMTNKNLFTEKLKNRKTFLTNLQNTEAAMQRCSKEKVLRKSAANL